MNLETEYLAVVHQPQGRPLKLWDKREKRNDPWPSDIWFVSKKSIKDALERIKKKEVYPRLCRISCVRPAFTMQSWMARVKCAMSMRCMVGACYLPIDELLLMDDVITWTYDHRKTDKDLRSIYDVVMEMHKQSFK